jgi:hypothetical protein
MNDDNTLENFFHSRNKKLLITKWKHYFDIYDTYFKKFKGKNPTILEIGVYNGGSLEMWNNYFEGNCTIYGVDINENCKIVPKILNANNIFIEIGDQGNVNFWNMFKQKVPKFDIIIDDGGHQMDQQITTFECMYEHVKDEGIYICEDMHTSYWAQDKGGLKKEGTFVEYTKNFIDLINAYHTRVDNIYKNPIALSTEFRKNTKAIHYYDSVIVLERKYDDTPPISLTK